MSDDATGGTGRRLTEASAGSVALAALPGAAHAAAPAPRGGGAGSPEAAGGPEASPEASVVPPAALPVTLRVNGREHRLALDPRVTLLDALREHLGLTGAKKGCDLGQCGACTVLVGGRRVLSCFVLAGTVEGEVTTVEGLAGEGEPLHPMQQAFIEHDAFQCGYCTPGQILSAIACVREGHAGGEDEIREYMSGNLCRCAAYPNIVAAVAQAGRLMQAQDSARAQASAAPPGGAA